MKSERIVFLSSDHCAEILVAAVEEEALVAELVVVETELFLDAIFDSTNKIRSNF